MEEKERFKARWLRQPKLLEEFHRKIFDRSSELELEQERVRQLKEHMVNVKQEILYTGALCEMRDKEIREEEHQQKLAEREEGRLKQELKKLEALKTEVRQKKSLLEDRAFKKRADLEIAATSVGADKQALEDWMQRIETQNEDIFIMEKYLSQDDTKVKQLDLEMQQLTCKLRDRKGALDTMYTKTQALQVELDRASGEIRNAYAERDNLIAQWENVINQMRQRDSELKSFADRLMDTRTQVHESETELRERQSFLEAQKESTAEARRRVDEIFEALAKARQELMESETRRKNFRCELDALKRMVDKVASDLEVTRSKTSQLKKEKSRRGESLEHLRHLIINLKQKFDYISESKLTAEQLANEADAQLSAEEVQQEMLTKQLSKLQDNQFKTIQRMEELNNATKVTEQSLVGSKALLRMLSSKLAKMDALLLRYEEVLYKEDFQMQLLERRVGRMTGVHSDEEKTVMEAKIQQLTEQLDERTNTTNSLSNQLSSLRREIIREQREAQTLAEKSAAAENQLQTNELEVDIALKAKSKVAGTCQQLIVEQNLIRLEVKRLFEVYKKHQTKVYDLESTRQDLDLVVRERSEEIALHQKMLFGQSRIATEENGQLKLEVQARKARIDKLIRRYEILTSLMAPPEGEEKRSQAYYIIRAAQEKEELQRKGDQLDMETRRAEQELIALENTLAVMNGCNSVYRLSNSKLPPDADELKLIEELKEKLRVLSIKLRYDTDRLKEVRQLKKNLSETLHATENDIEVYRNQTSRLTAEREKINTKLRKQRERYDRAVKRMEKVQSSLEPMEEQQRAHLEMDVKVRMTKEFADHMIRECLSRFRSNGQLMEDAKAMFTASGLPFTSLSDRRPSRIARSLPSSSQSGTGCDSSLSSFRTPITSGTASPSGSVASSARSPLGDDRTIGSDPNSPDKRSSHWYAHRSSRFYAPSFDKKKALQDKPLSPSSIDLVQQAALPEQLPTSEREASAKSTSSKKRTSSPAYTAQILHQSVTMISLIFLCFTAPLAAYGSERVGIFIDVGYHASYRKKAVDFHSEITKNIQSMLRSYKRLSGLNVTCRFNEERNDLQKASVFCSTDLLTADTYDSDCPYLRRFLSTGWNNTLIKECDDVYLTEGAKNFSVYLTLNISKTVKWNSNYNSKKHKAAKELIEYLCSNISIASIGDRMIGSLVPSKTNPLFIIGVHVTVVVLAIIFQMMKESNEGSQQNRIQARQRTLELPLRSAKNETSSR
ncbi:unnamed protein product [Calicophoron daubneyi]|uniref:Coiled-coil domain-containing protein 39 n=1 Tax=Calicophoron daubneyi TaxID=300641 RepID=A0AAV2TL27_CALDB